MGEELQDGPPRARRFEMKVRMDASAIPLDAMMSDGLSGSRHGSAVGDHACVDARPADWERRVRSRILSLLTLAEDWSSYGAKCPSKEAADGALSLAQMGAAVGTPEPAVVPTAGGGVQLEWDVASLHLEAESLGAGRYTVVYEDSASGDEWDAQLESDLTCLAAALKKLGSAV
jgi:hypothetical protein